MEDEDGTVWEHEEWMDNGACRNPINDPDDWFSGEQRAVNRAKSVCNTECDVREQCLEWAMRKNEKHSIAGGLTRAERNTLRRRTA